MIILFTAKYREALYSQQKEDQELTVSGHELIAKFRLKLKKVGKNHQTIWVSPKSNPLHLYSGSDK